MSVKMHCNSNQPKYLKTQLGLTQLSSFEMATASINILYFKRYVCMSCHVWRSRSSHQTGWSTEFCKKSYFKILIQLHKTEISLLYFICEKKVFCKSFHFKRTWKCFCNKSMGQIMPRRDTYPYIGCIIQPVLRQQYILSCMLWLWNIVQQILRTRLRNREWLGAATPRVA